MLGRNLITGQTQTMLGSLGLGSLTYDKRSWLYEPLIRFIKPLDP
jgi:hypothetical protein